MNDHHPSPPRSGEARTPAAPGAHADAFAHMLETKLEQGYTVESQEGTSAVLATRGSRRWFGLGGRASSARELVEIDADGKFTSRKQS